MLGTGANEYTSLYTSVPCLDGASIESMGGLNRIVNSPNAASFICYRDSFSEAMLNYYTYYFNGSVFWQHAIDFDFVNELRPQYLILGCVERYLDNVIAANAGIANR